MSSSSLFTERGMNFKNPYINQSTCFILLSTLGFPYPTCNFKFWLSRLPSQGMHHASRHNEAVRTLQTPPLTLSNALWDALKSKLPPISPYLQAVAVVAGLCMVAYQAEECHVNGSRPYKEGFSMETEVFVKTIDDLKRQKRKFCYLP